LYAAVKERTGRLRAWQARLRQATARQAYRVTGETCGDGRRGRAAGGGERTLALNTEERSLDVRRGRLLVPGVTGAWLAHGGTRI